jgi:hypothetical protein
MIQIPVDFFIFFLMCQVVAPEGIGFHPITSNVFSHVCFQAYVMLRKTLMFSND